MNLKEHATRTRFKFPAQSIFIIITQQVQIYNMNTHAGNILQGMSVLQPLNNVCSGRGGGGGMARGAESIWRGRKHKGPGVGREISIASGSDATEKVPELREKGTGSGPVSSSSTVLFVCHNTQNTQDCSHTIYSMKIWLW